MARPARLLACGVLAALVPLAWHEPVAAVPVPRPVVQPVASPVARPGAQPGADGAAVDFMRDVRPILSDRCFICHGPDAEARESDLRLDDFEGATEDLGGYAAIVPGDPEASELMQRVTHERARKRMPPGRSKLSLSEPEIETLRRWIADGARYETHWAYRAPRARELPVVAQAGWPRDDLDRFVLARLEAEGLAPAPETRRETWLRRVSFDLTGLPPTLAELDAFLADVAPGAYERVVDRLLASPRYGERMASDWLDAARYADSYGYQNDVERRVWPWRDWVVRAFNDDLGWDRFATWQLAGDLLPEPTRDQQLATAFNRLHRQTNEGGSVEEEYRVEYVSDRVHTFGTAFLGLTLECARCHDHKYDPILQRDYYALSAFFDDIDESGLYSHFTSAVPTPTLTLSTELHEQQLIELRAAVTVAERAVEARRAEAQTQAPAQAQAQTQAAWAPGAGPLEFPAPGDELPGCVGAFDFDDSEADCLWNRVDQAREGRMTGAPARAVGRSGTGLALDGDDNAHFPGVGAFTRDDPFTIALWMRVPEVKQRAVVLHRSRAWTDSGSRGYELLIEEGELSAALIHFWPGNALRVRTERALPVGRWVHVAMAYDGSSRAAGLQLFVDGEPAATRVIRDGLTRTIVDGDSTLTLGERFRDVGLAGGVVDGLRVFDRRLGPLEVRHLATGESLDALFAESPEEAARFRAETQDAELAQRLADLRTARRALAAAVDEIPEIMTMRDRASPRSAFVLERGSYLERGEPVTPGTLSAIAPFPADLPPDRLGLARWLVRPENPLFARVTVNRLWRLAFGDGLVASAENFGSQGTPPEHAELLDHLALELRAMDWSVKRFMRRLVLSATYRQSSRAGEGAGEGAGKGASEVAAGDLDPNEGNRLLAHGPRRRLSAEMIRDQALFASGLLVEFVGGPPTKPYQPPGLWQEKSGTVYRADKGPGLWRRSLYTFWKSTSPPPAMLIFDAAERAVCVAQRQRTSTPLQTLALWNDPQLVEAARAMAARVLSREPDDDARISHVFRALTGRRPTAEEHTVLRELLENARARFAAAPRQAQALLEVGDSHAAFGVDPVEAAALAVVVNTLFAYDGVLTLR